MTYSVWINKSMLLGRQLVPLHYTAGQRGPRWPAVGWLQPELVGFNLRRTPVNELLGEAVVAQQRAGAEPAQRHLDGRCQARGEHVGWQIGVLK